MKKYKLYIKKELPRGLVIGGFLAIFFILILLPFIAWLLEYKDTIQAPLTITTKSTPIDVYSKMSGELVLLVKNDSLVQKGMLLGYIKNTAELADVHLLKTCLQSQDDDDIAIAKNLRQHEDLEVGILKPSLIKVIKAFTDYETFLKTDRHQTFVASRRGQIKLYKDRMSLLDEKAALLDNDIAFAEKFEEQDRQLLASEAIAQREYDKSSQGRLGKKMADLDNATLLNALAIEIETLQRENIEIESRYLSEKLLLENTIRDNLQLLRNQLSKWELTYLIEASADGICIHKEYLSDYQFVEAEEKVFSLVPKENPVYFGLAKLPTVGVGKVKQDQEVYVKLNNYPFMEFGVLKGKVASVSIIPFDNQYNMQIEFPDGFVSTYGYNLETTPRMYGIAEVVVAKKSLYNRIMEQVKSVRYNR